MQTLEISTLSLPVSALLQAVANLQGRLPWIRIPFILGGIHVYDSNVIVTLAVSLVDYCKQKKKKNLEKTLLHSIRHYCMKVLGDFVIERLTLLPSKCRLQQHLDRHFEEHRANKETNDSVTVSG